MCVCVTSTIQKAHEKPTKTSASRERRKNKPNQRVKLEPNRVVREYMILRRTLSWEDNFNHVCLAYMSDLSVGHTYEHDESWLLIFKAI